MDLTEMLTKATDTITVRRVFGEPIHSEGAMVIPVAWVAGGAGGGGGESEQGNGVGGGSGLLAGPAGVYRVQDGNVTWHPAINVNRAILGGQALAALALLRLVRRRTDGTAASHHRSGRRQKP
jgi:uncharacterized spore protein YtfJ